MRSLVGAIDSTGLSNDILASTTVLVADVPDRSRVVPQIIVVRDMGWTSALHGDVRFSSTAEKQMSGSTLFALDPFVLIVARMDIDIGLDLICFIADSFVIGVAKVVGIPPHVTMNLTVLRSFCRLLQRCFVSRRWQERFLELSLVSFWRGLSDIMYWAGSYRTDARWVLLYDRILWRTNLWRHSMQVLFKTYSLLKAPYINNLVSRDFVYCVGDTDKISV